MGHGFWVSCPLILKALLTFKILTRHLPNIIHLLNINQIDDVSSKTTFHFATRSRYYLRTNKIVSSIKQSVQGIRQAPVDVRFPNNGIAIVGDLDPVEATTIIASLLPALTPPKRNALAKISKTQGDAFLEKTTTSPLTKSMRSLHISWKIMFGNVKGFATLRFS